jgi:hypothetical protein
MFIDLNYENPGLPPIKLFVHLQIVRWPQLIAYIGSCVNLRRKPILSIKRKILTNIK